MKLYYWDKYWHVTIGTPKIQFWELTWIPPDETIETTQQLLKRRGYCTCVAAETFTERVMQKSKHSKLQIAYELLKIS